MNMHRLAMGVAVALAMAVGISMAKDKDEESLFEGTTSVTIITTEIDTNGDGRNATLATGILVSNQGRFLFQSLIEFLSPIVPTGACPSGNLELPLLLNRIVSNHEETGDQLFSQLTSGTLCLNPAAGTSSFSGEGIFTGGTGEFGGATGSFTQTFTAATLVSTPGPPQRAFLRATSTITGTLLITDDD